MSGIRAGALCHVAFAVAGPTAILVASAIAERVGVPYRSPTSSPVLADAG